MNYEIHVWVAICNIWNLVLSFSLGQQG